MSHNARFQVQRIDFDAALMYVPGYPSRPRSCLKRRCYADALKERFRSKRDFQPYQLRETPPTVHPDE
jgi:hypothetical protein